MARLLHTGGGLEDIAIIVERYSHYLRQRGIGIELPPADIGYRLRVDCGRIARHVCLRHVKPGVGKIPGAGA